MLATTHQLHVSSIYNDRMGSIRHDEAQLLTHGVASKCPFSTTSYSIPSTIQEGVQIISKLVRKTILCRHDVAHINRVYRIIDHFEKKVVKIPGTNSHNVLQDVIKKVKEMNRQSCKDLISLFALRHFEALPIEEAFKNYFFNDFVLTTQKLCEIITLLPNCSSEIQFDEDVEYLRKQFRITDTILNIIKYRKKQMRGYSLLKAFPVEQQIGCPIEKQKQSVAKLITSHVNVQNDPSFGTAFLVHKLYVLTAAHCVCVPMQRTLDSKKIRNLRLVFSNEDVYEIEKVVAYSCSTNWYFINSSAQRHENHFSDWALLKLNKEVEGRVPLELDFSGTVNGNDQLFMLGYTHQRDSFPGFARGCVIESTDSKILCSAIETLSSPGSPLFNAKTSKVVALTIAGLSQYNHQDEYVEKYTPDISDNGFAQYCHKISQLDFVKILLKAEEGDKEASLQLAQEYREGTNTVEDFDACKDVLSGVAKSRWSWVKRKLSCCMYFTHEAEALYQLGCLHERRGFLEEAAQYYKDSALFGHKEACKKVDKISNKKESSRGHRRSGSEDLHKHKE